MLVNSQNRLSLLSGLSSMFNRKRVCFWFLKTVGLNSGLNLPGCCIVEVQRNWLRCSISCLIIFHQLFYRHYQILVSGQASFGNGLGLSSTTLLHLVCGLELSMLLKWCKFCKGIVLHDWFWWLFMYIASGFNRTVCLWPNNNNNNAWSLIARKSEFMARSKETLVEAKM